MKRSLVLVVALTIPACVQANFRRAGFAGPAPTPTLALAPLACGSATRPNHETREMLASLAHEYGARVGSYEPVATETEERLCSELAKDPDDRTRTAKLVRELAQVSGAASVAMVALDEPSKCGPEQLAIRDANGSYVGSVETGGTACQYTNAILRALVFDRDGRLLWQASLGVNPYRADDKRVDDAERFAHDLVAQLPATFEAHPEHATAINTGGGARYPTAAAYPAFGGGTSGFVGQDGALTLKAPDVCRKALERCDALAIAQAGQCRSGLVVTLRDIQPASAAAMCAQYGTMIGAMAPH